MWIAAVAKSARSFVPVPLLVFSCYLVVIYMNGFWTHIIGKTHLIVSGAIFCASVVACVLSYKIYRNDVVGFDTLIYSAYLSVSWLILLLTFGLICITGSTKMGEYGFWIDTFFGMHSETFYCDTFRRVYNSGIHREYFLQSRMLVVHDAAICILVLSLVMHIIFVENYEKVVTFLEADSDVKVQDSETIDIAVG